MDVPRGGRKETGDAWRELDRRMNGENEGGKEGTEGRADEWPGNPDRICPTDPTRRDSPVALESTTVYGFSNGFARLFVPVARVLASFVLASITKISA